MRAEIYGCFAEELPPYNGTLTLIYLRAREKGEKEGGGGGGGEEKNKTGGRKKKKKTFKTKQNKKKEKKKPGLSLG